MITYDYPDLFITDGTTKDILITDGTVTVVDDAYVVEDYTVKFNNNDIENEAFELYQNLCSEQDLQIGFCGTGKVTFSVRKHYVDSILGTEVKIYLIPNHDASKMLQIAVVKIAEDKSSDNYNRHVITAYDAMYDILNADVTDWYDDILQDEEATCYMDDFRDTFLNQFGVEAESTTLINDGLVLRRTIEKDRISGAEIIKAICEINGCFGTITNEGKFRFKSLAPNIVSAADLDTIPVSKYIDISYAEHGFKSIKKVKIVRDNKTIVTSSQTATGDYNTVTIAYNPLVADYTEADLQTVANTLCDALKGHIYCPCTLNAIGNPLHEVGDPIEIVTKYGFDVITYIFERRLKGIQALRDTYTANGEEYLSENLNSSYTQSRSTESAISQLSQSASSSGLDFVETIRNIGFRLLDEPSNVSVEYDEDNVEVSLKWTDPADIATSEPVTATWAGTVVVRKEGSAPRHRWDGTLITDSTTRNQYTSAALIDNTALLNKEYYYGIFPYDTSNPIEHYRYTKSVKVETFHNPIIYGFHIDGSASNPSNRVTYIESAIGKTPAHMNYSTGMFDYGSWEDAFFMPRPVMLNFDGTVAYYLDPDDYSKKKDGTASDVADTSFNGNAMMEWGRDGTKIWTKIVPTGNGDSANIYIANYKVDEGYHAWNFVNNQGNYVNHFYTPIYNGSLISNKMRSLSGCQVSKSLSASAEIGYCEANNPGADKMWFTEVWADVLLINFLLILIGKSTDTQTVFGNGLTHGGSETISNSFKTGVHNDKGLFYGTNSGSIALNSYGNAVKVFGMENWWGFQWRRIAGLINVLGDIKYKLTYGMEDGSTAAAYNTTGSGYKSSGVTPSGTSGGYISQDRFLADGMYPAVANGTGWTYDCDGLWFDNSITSYAIRGGDASSSAVYSQRAGFVSTILLDGASLTDWTVGCAPSCKPLT